MSKREIKVTSDYKIFKIYKENRDVDPGHLSKLMKVIEERNLLCDLPIIVDKDLFVIDGQTRLEAAKKLEIPIYYAIGIKAERKDVAILNIASQTWLYSDWLKHYCSLGNKNYLKFRKFMKKNDFTLANSLMLFKHYKDRRHSFKNGLFIYPQEDIYQHNIISQLNEWEELVGNVKIKRSFISALTLLNHFSDYSHERMILKTTAVLEKKRVDFDLTTRESIIGVLNEIYNSNVKSDSQLVYFPRSPSRRRTAEYEIK